jgi:hypothetical protein
MLIGVFFTPMSQSQDCKARKNKEAGVKNTPASVRFVCFSLWATAPGDPGEAGNVFTYLDHNRIIYTILLRAHRRASFTPSS